MAAKKSTVKALYKHARTLDLETLCAKMDLLERLGWVRFPNGLWFDKETAQRYASNPGGLLGYDSTEAAFKAVCYELEKAGKVG